MQSITAAAGFCGVKFQAKIVPAEEPVEGAPRLFIPPGIRSRAKGFETGRNRCLSLDGLLVEIGPRAAAPIKAIAADRAKMSLLRSLEFCRANASACSPRSKTCVRPVALPAENQGMGEFRVIVSQLVFKPPPVGCAASSKEFHEPGCERFASLVDGAVTLRRRKYSWMPMRAKAHARGEVNSVTAGKRVAKSARPSPENCDMANAPRQRPVPRARGHGNLPIPVRRASGGQNSDGCGSACVLRSNA